MPVNICCCTEGRPIEAVLNVGAGALCCPVGCVGMKRRGPVGLTGTSGGGSLPEVTGGGGAARRVRIVCIWFACWTSACWSISCCLADCITICPDCNTICFIWSISFFMLSEACFSLILSICCFTFSACSAWLRAIASSDPGTGVAGLTGPALVASVEVEAGEGTSGAIKSRELRSLLLSVLSGALGLGRPAGDEASLLSFLGEPLFAGSSSGSTTFGAVEDANFAIHSSSSSRFWFL